LKKIITFTLDEEVIRRLDMVVKERERNTGEKRKRSEIVNDALAIFLFPELTKKANI